MLVHVGISVEWSELISLWRHRQKTSVKKVLSDNIFQCVFDFSIPGQGTKTWFTDSYKDGHTNQLGEKQETVMRRMYT